MGWNKGQTFKKKFDKFCPLLTVCGCASMLWAIIHDGVLIEVNWPARTKENCATVVELILMDHQAVLD